MNEKSSYKYLTIERKGEYAVLQLDRGKANVINHEMVHEIHAAVDEIEADNSLRGVIYTGKPGFFSAGLDVIELHGYDEDQIRSFFRDFIGMFTKLLAFPKLAICSITGHCPAGGCIIAITCDYRIMADDSKYTIGLNEVAVNILISKIIFDTYSFWIGQRHAHQNLLEGKLLSPQEAHQQGLVDVLCADEDVLKSAEKKMKDYLGFKDHTIVATKAVLRRGLWEKIEHMDERQLGNGLALWWDPENVKARQFMVDWLNAKKAQKV